MIRRTSPLLDDIITFLPGISEEEYQVRAKIRSHRNAAGAIIAQTESSTARQLAWIASDWATEAVYTPAETNLLRDVAKLCSRLLITAMQAERLETVGGEL